MVRFKVFLGSYLRRAAQPDTHDGGYYVSPKEIERLRKRAEKLRNLADDKRKADKERLSKAVEDAYNRVFGIEEQPAPAETPTTTTETAPQAPTEPPPRIDWDRVGTDINEVLRILALIEQEARLKWDMERDEDDVMALLMAA